MRELLVGLAGAIVGVYLTMIWDLYKNRKKFKDYLLILLAEMEGSFERMKTDVGNLPPELRKKIGKKPPENKINKNDIKGLPWNNPLNLILMLGKYLSHQDS